MNASGKTPLDFLMNPPRVNAVYATNGIPALVDGATQVVVPLATEAWDTDGMHSTTTNPSRITFNTPGLYQITFFARFLSNSAGTRSINLRLNSGGLPAAGSTLNTWVFTATNGSSSSFSRTVDYLATVGDHIEMWVSANTGNASTVTLDAGDRVTGMHVRWVATDNTS